MTIECSLQTFLQEMEWKRIMCSEGAGVQAAGGDLGGCLDTSQGGKPALRVLSPLSEVAQSLTSSTQSTAAAPSCPSPAPRGNQTLFMVPVGHCNDVH